MIHIMETLIIEYEINFNDLAKIIDFFIDFLSRK